MTLSNAFSENTIPYNSILKLLSVAGQDILLKEDNHISQMIIDAIEIIEKYDSVDAQEQNGDSQYFSFPKERDINNFIKAGNCLFAEKELIEFGFA